MYLKENRPVRNLTASSPRPLVLQLGQTVPNLTSLLYRRPTQRQQVERQDPAEKLKSLRGLRTDTGKY